MACPQFLFTLFLTVDVCNKRASCPAITPCLWCLAFQDGHIPPGTISQNRLSLPLLPKQHWSDNILLFSSSLYIEKHPHSYPNSVIIYPLRQCLNIQAQKLFITAMALYTPGTFRTLFQKHCLVNTPMGPHLLFESLSLPCNWENPLFWNQRKCFSGSF